MEIKIPVGKAMALDMQGLEESQSEYALFSHCIMRSFGCLEDQRNLVLADNGDLRESACLWQAPVLAKHLSFHGLSVLHKWLFRVLQSSLGCSEPPGLRDASEERYSPLL